MEKPSTSKGKVIIIPRPPRASNEEWVPVNPTVETVETAEASEAAAAVEAIDPNAGSLGPQTVTGPQASPFGGLKGAASPACGEAAGKK